MAEVVGTVAAALAFAELSLKLGTELQKRIQEYKEVHKAIEHFRSFGSKRFTNIYNEGFDTVQLSLKSSAVSDELKAKLSEDLQDLSVRLKDAKQLLDRYVDRNGDIIWRYRLSATSKLKTCFDGLEQWIDPFLDDLKLVEIYRSTRRNATYLRGEWFQVVRRVKGPKVARLSMAIAQLKIGSKWRTIHCVIEHKTTLNRADQEENEENTANLAKALSERAAGMLMCLGYQKEPLELIFQLPCSPGDCQTLYELMSSDHTIDYGGGHPLEHRLDLACQLARAVSSVHVRGLVHKSIRPDTLLIAKGFSTENDQPPQDHVEIGTLYLTNWAIARSIDGPTLKDRNQGWENDIYRHSSSQGQGADDAELVGRHNMGHDIYSLGVCLLEIGLWKPLLKALEPTKDNKAPRRLNYIMANKAISLKLMDRPLHGSGERVLWPENVKLVLEALATELLPQRMGSLYADIVLLCLRSLDQGLGSIQDFETVEPHRVGMVFNDLILAKLSSIRVS